MTDTDSCLIFVISIVLGFLTPRLFRTFAVNVPSSSYRFDNFLILKFRYLVTTGVIQDGVSLSLVRFNGRLHVFAFPFYSELVHFGLHLVHLIWLYVKDYSPKLFFVGQLVFALVPVESTLWIISEFLERVAKS